jgi:hypothetical protein
MLSPRAVAADDPNSNDTDEFDDVAEVGDAYSDDSAGDDWEAVDAAPAGAAPARAGYGSRRRVEDPEEEGGVVDAGNNVRGYTTSKHAEKNAEEEGIMVEEEIIGEEEEEEELPNGGVTPARPRLVVLVPTRELAAQVTFQARRIAFNTGLKTALIHGGQSVKPQLEQLAQGPDILVSTPGRLLTCANDEPYLDLSGVTTLVIDEADQMLDMGFEPQVREIINRSGMPRPAPGPMSPGGPRGAGRQSLMFSATFPDKVQRLAEALVIGYSGEGYGGVNSMTEDGVRVYSRGSAAPPPARVAVGRVGSTVAGIEQRILPAENSRDRKLDLLIAVLRAVPESRTLVFCAGKGTAQWVRGQLQRLLEEEAGREKAAEALAVGP